jgi:hypothetical protein
LARGKLSLTIIEAIISPNALPSAV